MRGTRLRDVPSDATFRFVEFTTDGERRRFVGKKKYDIHQGAVIVYRPARLRDHERLLEGRWLHYILPATKKVLVL